MEKDEEDKVKRVIKIIDDMDIKDKLRLGIRITESDYIHLIYDKQKLNQKYDTMLREIDEKYRKTLSTFREYFNVGFAVSKMFEMNDEQQNQVALHLFNNINI